MSIGNLKRRDFVKVFGLASGGLILGCNFSGDQGPVINTLEDGVSFVPNLFVQLQKDGKLTIVVARSEMGQGIRTSMASAIADEMEADWAFVSVQQATGDAKFGNQNTDGSRSIRTLLNPMRKMGAMARLILEKAAAKQWGVDHVECHAKNHYVVHTSGKKLAFGALVDAAREVGIPKDEEIILKDKKNFKYIGKGLHSIDMNDFTHGTATFGLDARLPNMKYAAIARCPATFGTVKSIDDSDARSVYGVEDIVQLERMKPSAGEQFYGMLGGVAVIASNTWSAIQGKNSLMVDWDMG
jgi:isoquinoline 1-oxidoreductase beta subunit